MRPCVITQGNFRVSSAWPRILPFGGNGGKLVGSRSFDPGQTDYSSLIVDALSSGAKVLLLTAAGFPAIAAVRQFGEFTGHGKMRPVCPFLMMTDVDAIGLNAAQGALVCG